MQLFSEKTIVEFVEENQKAGIVESLNEMSAQIKQFAFDTASLNVFKCSDVRYRPVFFQREHKIEEYYIVCVHGRCLVMNAENDFWRLLKMSFLVRVSSWER